MSDHTKAANPEPHAAPIHVPLEWDTRGIERVTRAKPVWGVFP